MPRSLLSFAALTACTAASVAALAAELPVPTPEAHQLLACDQASSLRDMASLSVPEGTLDETRPIALLLDVSGRVLWSRSTPTAEHLTKIAAERGYELVDGQLNPVGAPELELVLGDDGTLTAGMLGTGELPDDYYARIDLDERGCWAWAREPAGVLHLAADLGSGQLWADPEASAEGFGISAAELSGSVQSEVLNAPRTEWAPQAVVRYNLENKPSKVDPLAARGQPLVHDVAMMMATSCEPWAAGVTVALAADAMAVSCPSDDPEVAIAALVEAVDPSLFEPVKADGIWDLGPLSFARYVLARRDDWVGSSERGVIEQISERGGGRWWATDRSTGSPGVLVHTDMAHMYLWSEGDMVRVEMTVPEPGHFKETLGSQQLIPMHEVSDVLPPRPSPVIGGLLGTSVGHEVVCAQGDQEACAQVAQDLMERGVELERARELADQACAAQEAAACYTAGALWANGQGGDQDHSVANERFHGGCDGGFAMSCWALAEQVRAGRGAESDPELAKGLYRQACEGGAGRACGAVAWAMVAEGTSERDPEFGRLLREACMAGDAPECVNASEWSLISGERGWAQWAAGAARQGSLPIDKWLVDAVLTLSWCSSATCHEQARTAWTSLPDEPALGWSWDGYLEHLAGRPLGEQHIAVVEAARAVPRDDAADAVFIERLAALEQAQRAAGGPLQEIDVPVLSRPVSPSYPESARGSGDVLCFVHLRIDAQGAAQEVAVEGCPEVFEPAVRESIGQWRWRPVLDSDEQPVEANFWVNALFVDPSAD